MIPSEIIPVATELLAMTEPFIVEGPPAIAKTDSIKQAMSAVGIKPENQVIFHPAVMDPTDVKGLGCLIDGGAEFVPFGKFKKLVDATEPTCAFFDDMGHGTQTVQASLMQLFLERSCGATALPPCVSLCGATNRKVDNAGVKSLIQPLISRLTILSMEVTDSFVEDWVRWAFQNDMPAEIISFIRFRPKLLWDWNPQHKDSTGNTLVNQPLPRTVATVGRLWARGDKGNESAKVLRRHDVIAGAAGENFATEFLGFIALMEQLGDLPLRITKGQANGVDCPSDPSVLYALTGSLARWAGNDPSTLPNIAKWCRGYLPPEFQLRLLQDGETQHGEKFTNTTDFIDWSLEANKFFQKEVF